MLYLGMGALALGSLLTCFADTAGAAPADNPVVVLETSLGSITIELDQAKAPITVANFLKYVDEGYYNGLIFHRVMSDFMIQGGGMDDQLQPKKTNAPIKNEASNGLSNVRGTIAMARTSAPDSATSQFFINLFDRNSANLDYQPGSPGYCVFGKVIAGMDVVDAIARVPLAGRGDHVPLKPVYIKSAKRKS
jgi:cyclophilin family peptidyl-prolyl cis-trans isomerase